MKIGILTEKFSVWPGGIEFVKYVTVGLRENKNNELTLLIFDENSFEQKLKRIVKNIIRFVFRNKYPKEFLIKNNAQRLTSALNIESFILYTNKRQLEKIINQNFDIVLPSFNNLNSKIKVPVLNYIFDFQHKYLSGNFSKKEVTVRDKHFKSIILNNSPIIVNAEDVKKDIFKFFGREKDVLVIPFSPIQYERNNDKIINPQEILDKYRLTGRNYFIICNQFWHHKGHLTALKAVKDARDTFNIKLKVVLTGRFPDEKTLKYCKEISDYIKECHIEDNIIFTGFIDKAEQIILLSNAEALLQPTEFEGGPGGFSVYEALSLRVKCIVSNIAVNTEISDDLVTFFEKSDVRDLTNKLINSHNKPSKFQSLEEIESQSSRNVKKLEHFWDQIITKYCV